MSKDVGFCSITEDLCKKDEKCEECSLKHIHENLEHYAKLHEENRLIELPCKVGDTVYIVWKNFDFSSCKECTQDDCGSCPYDVYEIAERPFDYKYLDQRYIYTTKEEAEAKLAELKGTEE